MKKNKKLLIFITTLCMLLFCFVGYIYAGDVHITDDFEATDTSHKGKDVTQVGVPDWGGEIKWDYILTGSFKFNGKTYSIDDYVKNYPQGGYPTICEGSYIFRSSDDLNDFDPVKIIDKHKKLFKANMTSKETFEIIQKSLDVVRIYFDKKDKTITNVDKSDVIYKTFREGKEKEVSYDFTNMKAVIRAVVPLKEKSGYAVYAFQDTRSDANKERVYSKIYLAMMDNTTANPFLDYTDTKVNKIRKALANKNAGLGILYKDGSFEITTKDLLDNVNKKLQYRDFEGFKNIVPQKVKINFYKHYSLQNTLIGTVTIKEGEKVSSSEYNNKTKSYIDDLKDLTFEGFYPEKKGKGTKFSLNTVYKEGVKSADYYAYCTVKVTFVNKKGTAPAAQKIAYNGSLTSLPKATDKSGKSKFVGWSEEQDGVDIVTSDKRYNKHTTLYAIFDDSNEEGEKCTITYVSEGIEIGKQTVVKDTNLKKMKSAPTHSENKVFKEWNRKEDGTGKKLSIGDKISESFKVYAQWIGTGKGHDEDGGDEDIPEPDNDNPETPYLTFKPNSHEEWTKEDIVVLSELHYPQPPNYYFGRQYYDLIGCTCHSSEYGCSFLGCSGYPVPCPGHCAIGTRKVKRKVSTPTYDPVSKKMVNVTHEVEETETIYGDCGKSHTEYCSDHSTCTHGSTCTIVNAPHNHTHISIVSCKKAYDPDYLTITGGGHSFGFNGTLVNYITLTNEAPTRDGYSLDGVYTVKEGTYMPSPLSYPYVEGADYPPASITKSSGIYRIDKSVPDLTVSVGTTAWTNQDVDYSTAGSDRLSGLDSARTEVNGVPVDSANNIETNSYTYANTLTESGTYTVKIFGEDKVGWETCVRSEKVRIDKIPPTISYALPERMTSYNDIAGRKRYETSAKNTGFFINVADLGGPEKSSGLSIAKCKVFLEGTYDANSSRALSGEGVIDLMPYLESMKSGRYIKIEIPEDMKKEGKKVALVLYAKDVAGNEAYTTTETAKKDDYENITVATTEKESDPAFVGPKNNKTQDDIKIRPVPTSEIYINNGNKIDTDKVLVITNVCDINWKNSIESPVRATDFAVYQNKVNDTIGLGYRVDFKYSTFGYNIDDGDRTIIYVTPYAQIGTEYKEMELYKIDDRGKIEEVTEKYNKLEYVRTADKAGYTGDGKDVPLMGQRYTTAGNKASMYFNYYIPDNIKFRVKRPGESKDCLTDKELQQQFVNINELLIKFEVQSYKHMSGGTALPYYYTTDPETPQGKTGVTTYGRAKYINTVPKGQVFWYDAIKSASKDVTGRRS